jgi:adenine deaminase
MVSELLKRGVDFFKVIKAAAVNAVKHYNLKTGLLKKGDSADFILYDPVNFKIAATVLKGRIVSLNGEKKIKRNTPEQLESINNRNFSKNDFLIHHEKSCINVIRVIKDSLMTKRMKVRPNIIDGHAVSDINRDILRFSVVSRYNTDDIAHAFVNGFGIKYGAMASSVSHDSHNVAVIGADEESMARACELVFENQGGLVWYCPEESFVLPLSAAGLISLSDCADTAASYQKLNELVTKAGSLLRAPFMTLSFLSLPVIPDIKLTSKGLFDVRENKFRPLFEKC